MTGSVLLLLFNDNGEIEERLQLSAQGPNFGIELPENTWHTLIAERSGTCIVEIKQGPYSRLNDKDFAAWSPQEGSPGVREFLQRCRNASIGETLL